MLNDQELESLQVFKLTRVGVQEILSISESTGFCYFFSFNVARPTLGDTLP